MHNHFYLASSVQTLCVVYYSHYAREASRTWLALASFRQRAPSSTLFNPELEVYTGSATSGHSGPGSDDDDSVAPVVPGSNLLSDSGHRL